MSKGSKRARLALENFQYIFSRIKPVIDQMLARDNYTSYTKNPFVDIETIARNVGITLILYVSPELVSNEHALLKGSVIHVNNRDSKEEQRFSIAHEIFHFISKEKRGVLSAARSVANPRLKIWETNNMSSGEGMAKKMAKDTSKKIGEVVANKIGKSISEKTEKAIYEKIGKTVERIMRKSFIGMEGKTISDKIIKAIDDEVKKAIIEEIADYFAANLLIPTERFILWEDKQNEEIARAFGVNVGCIKKRREEEIETELDFISPKDLLSDKVENYTPLSLDELNRILEGGNNTYATRRT